MHFLLQQSQKPAHQHRRYTVDVTAAEKHHSPLHCALILCLVSMNTEQESVKVKGVILSMCRNSMTKLFFIFQYQTALCQTAPLLPYITWQQNIMEYGQECSVSTAVLPTSASDTVDQHYKIKGIGASLLYPSRK